MFNLSNLKTLQIKTRITVLVAMPMVGLFLLGAAYLISDGQIDKATTDSGASQVLRQTADDMAFNALQMRRREKDFLLRDDLKYAANYRDNAGIVIADAEAISAMPAAAGLDEPLGRLVSGTRQHIGQFEKVVELKQHIGLDEDSGLQGQLRGAVHDVEELVREANQDALLVKMLMMRRHEKDFILRRDGKYVGQIDERRTEFDTLLRSSLVTLAKQGEISTMMDEYQKTFHEFAQASLTFDAEVAKLSTIYALMQPEYEKMSKRRGLVLSRRTVSCNRHET